MRSRLLSACLWALPFGSLAQTQVSNQFIGDKFRTESEIGSNGYDVVAFDIHDKATKGSPMLLPRWVQGEVWLIGNKKPIATILKYDVYRQQLRVRRSQGDSVIVPVTQVQHFTLTEITVAGQPRARQFVRCEGPGLPPEIAASFAEVLSQGEHLQLLKVWTKNLQKTTESSSYSGTGTTVTSFADKQQYYLKLLADGHLTSIRPKRNALKEALAGQPALLSKLADYKEGIGNEAELTDVLRTIDPLPAAMR